MGVMGDELQGAVMPRLVLLARPGLYIGNRASREKGPCPVGAEPG